MLLFLSRKVSVIQTHINNWENDGKSDFNFEVETITLNVSATVVTFVSVYCKPSSTPFFLLNKCKVCFVDFCIVFCTIWEGGKLFRQCYFM